MSDQQDDPQDDAARGAAHRPGAALVGAVAVLALVLAVLAAAATGPWVRRPIGGAGAGGSGPAATESLPTPSMTRPSLPFDDTAATTGENPVMRWVLYGLALLLTLALVALVARLLVALVRRRDLPPTAAREVGTAVDGPDVDAPAVREGIGAAEAILGSARPPRDAIVAAWLALEEAAERAGVARRPAQTPTEFTAAVLERTPADGAAVDVLRRLYLRVRFSDDPVDRADAEAARSALAAVAASWSDAEVRP